MFINDFLKSNFSFVVFSQNKIFADIYI